MEHRPLPPLEISGGDTYEDKNKNKANTRHLFGTVPWIVIPACNWVWLPFVGFVDRCLSRTRNLAASNKHLAEFFSGRSWPKIGPGIVFFGVFEKLETSFSKICAHSERYRNLLAGMFEILTFMQKSRFHFHRSYVRLIRIIPKRV